MKKFCIIFSLLALLNACSHSQGLEVKEIQVFVDEMLVSNAFTAKIQKTFPIIDNIQVVLLEIPYREFPSIILLKMDVKTDQWKRTFECLSPGIQDEPSGLLDWHTKGCGVDFIIDKDTVNYFHSKKVESMVETTMDSKGGVIIPYQNFLHMHTSDSSEHKITTPYTIDKTNYRDFANMLMDNKYETYPSDNCEMFDSPKIIECKFFKENGLYVIEAYTANAQKWIYKFEGVDSNNKYLLKKSIVVAKANS